MTVPEPQSPFAVARYFIENGIQDSVVDLTPMKLLKLTYLAHGWTLCFTDAPLIRESVQAWKYGPVIPSLYEYFKRYGRSPVDAAAEINVLPEMSQPTPNQTKWIHGVLGGVWTAYKGYSGLQLSALTHIDGSPWHVTWFERGGKDRMGCAIDNLLIRDYFKALLPADRGAHSEVLA